MKAFGDSLRQAREAKGVTLGAVARATRIRERYLEALEQIDLEALPGSVFAKGYIKSYAQFLDLDPEPLLASYRVEERKSGRGTPEAEREKLEELARLVKAGPLPQAPARSRAPLLLACAGIVLVGLVSVSVWLAFRAPAPGGKPRALAEDSATRARSIAVAPTHSTAASEPLPSATSNAGGALAVAELGLGTGVVERNLVGRSDRFPEGSNVWLWTRVVGGARGDRIRHVWTHAGREVMNAELAVGASHWRTYSTLELSIGSAGEWTVEVRTADGAVLARESFHCVSPRDGT